MSAAPPDAPTPEPPLPELGFYGLAGHSATPRDLIGEVADAERLGLGSVFLSERFNTKDAAVLTGAAVAASERLGVATAATNHNTRHPLVTANMATTAHRMSEGRFTLGLGRGFDPLFDVMNLPRVTTARMADAIGLYRALWHGEAIVGHDGPAGAYPYLSMDASFDEDIPVALVAIGPRTLEFAGRVADAVVLHTFMTDDSLARSVEIVKNAAADAGRDPSSVRVWSVLAVVGDWIDEAAAQRKLVGRLASYLQGYGDVLAATNRWDTAVLTAFREDALVRSFTGAADAVATPEDLSRVAELLPGEWLAASATGTAAQCCARISDQFDRGADSVILHGATPRELEPVLPAWRAVRDAERFDPLPRNPGRSR